MDFRWWKKFILAGYGSTGTQLTAGYR